MRDKAAFSSSVEIVLVELVLGLLLSLSLLYFGKLCKLVSLVLALLLNTTSLFKSFFNSSFLLFSSKLLCLFLLNLLSLRSGISSLLGSLLLLILLLLFRFCSGICGGWLLLLFLNFLLLSSWNAS